MEKNKMNICIFNGDMSRGGGTERITQILANGLSEQAQYIIYVLNLNNESGKCFYPLNENVHFVVLNSVGIKNKIIELRHFLKKENIRCDFRSRVGFESVVWQANRTQQFRPLCDISAHIGGSLVHRAF